MTKPRAEVAGEVGGSGGNSALSWLELAREGDVVRRALRTALLVGTVLAVINHGDALLTGQLGSARLARIALTFLVPYAVSTAASVQTKRAFALQQSPSGTSSAPP